MKLKLWCCLFMFAVAPKAYSQLQQDICEEKIPNNWSTHKSKLTVSNAHFKIGKQAVQWNWNAANNSQITIVDDAFKTVAKDPRSTFVFWIYNEKPIKDKVKFVFYANGKENIAFDFNLDFSGWRTAWVMYHRDMRGKVSAEMNSLKIIAPASVKKGTLYFDNVMYNVNINPRSPMRDFQLPFVNLDGDKAANAHWNSLYQFATNPGYLSLEQTVSAKVANDIDSISKRYKEIVFPKKLRNKALDILEIKTELAFWNIKRTKNTITGKPVLSPNDYELVDKSLLAVAKKDNETTNIKRYSQFIWEVAKAYHSSKNIQEKTDLETIFIDLLDHLDNQGWAFGSGMGALHHLGYNLGDFYNAAFLMKDVIEKHQKLERTFKTMFWYSGLGRTLNTPDKLPVSNIDVFNTLLGSMLSSILILDDSPEKLCYLKHFSKWMSHNLQPDYDISGAFKPDGAVFHHGTLYPAYGVGGYSGLAPIIYALSKTDFEVEQAAHESFKYNMLMMHYYTNPTKWPISVSGRHPTGNWRIPDLPYAYMALAGSPDKKEAIDKEMAAVYLLIAKQKNNEFAKLFKTAGIKAANFPNGHWNLNYGLLAIHRKNNWLLTVKGHNRYFVSNESYPNANVYGRYINYGHLEVAFPEGEGQIPSHFEDKGWNWNRFPGTTTLNVPLEKLKADIKNVDDFSGVEEMLLTDELFAGGTAMQNNGIFAMKLRGHDKYNLGSFKAIKSWFMFDSLVVCLGSNINNDIIDYATETTVFQNYLNQKNERFWLANQSNNSFPYQFKELTKGFLTVVDNRRIGYYFPKNTPVNFVKETQYSKDQKDLQHTQGNFASLIIEHGKAPKNQSYQYTMVIGANANEMQAFAIQMHGKNPAYQILQQDSLMHSVKYNRLNTTGLSIFTSKQTLADKYVLKNSKPCLVMYKEGAEILDLSVTDPDLAFFEGPEDTPKNPDGTRQEVSIYSRAWYKTPSKPSIVELEVKGKWKLNHQSDVVKVKALTNGNTLIIINCKYGLANQFSLIKNKI